MKYIKKRKFYFLEASPAHYNNEDNCKFIRPYILDFSPLVNIYPPDSFANLVNSNSANSVAVPYSLLIQVALGYLDGAFSLISAGSGKVKFEKFIRGIFGAVHSCGNAAFFLHEQRKNEYDLNPGWSSALTQGQALSLWLRLKAFGDMFEDLDHIGLQLLNGMLNDVEEGGGLHRDPRTNELWLEEYPSVPASHVLNGYIFALFGLLEFNKHNDLDKLDDVAAKEENLIETLSVNINRYDKYGWSCYDLAKRNFAPTHYHMIHIYTLGYLSIMLDNQRLSTVANKWRSGIKLNNHGLIDILRGIGKVCRKAYVTVIGKRW